jgi:hypothetical protein
MVTRCSAGFYEIESIEDENKSQRNSGRSLGGKPSSTFPRDAAPATREGHQTPGRQVQSDMRPSADTSLPARVPVLLGGVDESLSWPAFAGMLAFLQGWPLVYFRLNEAWQTTLDSSWQTWCVPRCAELFAELCQLAAGLVLIGLADALYRRRDTLTAWYLSFVALLLAAGASSCLMLWPYWSQGFRDDALLIEATPLKMASWPLKLLIPPFGENLPCLIMIGFLWLHVLDSRRGKKPPVSKTWYLAAGWMVGTFFPSYVGALCEGCLHSSFPWRWLGSFGEFVLYQQGRIEALLLFAAILGLWVYGRLTLAGVSLIVLLESMNLCGSLYHTVFAPSTPASQSAMIPHLFELLTVRAAKHLMPWLLIWLVVVRELRCRRLLKTAGPKDPHCGRCGYNLHGLPDWQRCPECGGVLDWSSVNPPSSMNGLPSPVAAAPNAPP